MQNFNLQYLGNHLGLIRVVGWILTAAFVLLHVLFMMCVFNDGSRMQRAGRQTAVLTPVTWALAAFLMGLLGVSLYWVAHYSSFVRKDGNPGTA